MVELGRSINRIEKLERVARTHNWIDFEVEVEPKRERDTHTPCPERFSVGSSRTGDGTVPEVPDRKKEAYLTTFVSWNLFWELLDCGERHREMARY